MPKRTVPDDGLSRAIEAMLGPQPAWSWTGGLLELHAPHLVTIGRLAEAAKEAGHWARSVVGKADPPHVCEPIMRARWIAACQEAHARLSQWVPHGHPLADTTADLYTINRMIQAIHATILAACKGRTKTRPAAGAKSGHCGGVAAGSGSWSDQPSAVVLAGGLSCLARRRLASASR